MGAVILAQLIYEPCMLSFKKQLVSMHHCAPGNWHRHLSSIPGSAHEAMSLDPDFQQIQSPSAVRRLASSVLVECAPIIQCSFFSPEKGSLVLFF